MLTQSATKPRLIVSDLEKYGSLLLDFDCRIIIRAAEVPGLNTLSIITSAIDKLHLPTAGLPPNEAEKLKKWQPSGRGDPLLPHVHIYSESIPWANVANFLAENPPGPAPNFTLTIDSSPLDLQFAPDSKLLIRRAFWDCADVHLVSMSGGHSGVDVYRAHAELAAGLHGRWPLPYFVKLGAREKIMAEFQNYEGHVRSYVPFHLGPHLVPERCCLGATKGIIVGDYVAESESLRDCARQGRANSAIAASSIERLSAGIVGQRKNQLPFLNFSRIDFRTALRQLALRLLAH